MGLLNSALSVLSCSGKTGPTGCGAWVVLGPGGGPQIDQNRCLSLCFSLVFALGRFWSLLVALGRSWVALGRSWAVLGRSWVALGRFRGAGGDPKSIKIMVFPYVLSTVFALGRSWSLLVALGLSWVALGSSWGGLGSLLGGLGSLLGRSWAALGRSWVALGRS